MCTYIIKIKTSTDILFVAINTLLPTKIEDIVTKIKEAKDENKSLKIILEKVCRQNKWTWNEIGINAEINI